VNIGLPEVLILLLILLVIFGGRRIPELGRALGTGFRELREHVGGGSRGDEKIEASPEPARPSSEEPVEGEEVTKGR
jgi:sec-independent protein translocase protein TatA